MQVEIIGGGLAGCEAAYQLLKRGVKVVMYEMRPKVKSECHTTDDLAELVCSNSLKSTDENTAQGLLKRELELLDSLLISLAYKARVEAGSALAVDRRKFSKLILEALSSFNNFKLVRAEKSSVITNQKTIIATGPLTSDKMATFIKKLLFFEDSLYFYDAIAPIVDTSSLNMEKLFWQNRYDKGGKSAYLNVPLTKEEYLSFYNELKNTDRVILKSFEKRELFSGCQPIELIAETGVDSMRFGPLKPVGLTDKEGKRPYAVVQLRNEDQMSSAMNMVGFQTNLTYKEQKRVFSMLPGFERVNFFRYGSMHRNSYINSRKHLTDKMYLKKCNNIYFAGQIVGVEGYVESIMSGLFTALCVYSDLNNKDFKLVSNETMSGAILNYVINGDENQKLQPMAANFGLLPALKNRVRDKKQNKIKYKERALQAMNDWVRQYKF